MEGMDFQRKKISSDKKRLPIKKFFWIGILIVIVFFTIKLLFAGGASITNFILSMGGPLKADEQGHTNFVLVGTGGELHEGPDLTDSIIVATVDPKNKSIKLLSIPRDFYVETKVDGSDRINKVYTLAKNKYQDSKAGLEVLKKVVEDLIGSDIHYYVKVNFDGFEEVIDKIGGIDIYIDETINDPFYPKEGTIGYEPFYIEKGLQHLSGEEALKYVRSRKTTSDFDRSHRQQKMLFAVKDKMVKNGIFNDPDAIKDIFFSLKDDIETDLSIREMIQLASIGKEIEKQKIKTYILHDDPSTCGGFLYTPQRINYGGAFVLIPANDPMNPDDDYLYLHFFIDEIFKNHNLGTENIEIQILNGTESAGLAGHVKALLTRHCFNTLRFGNAQNKTVQTTTIYAKTENALNSETIKVIKGFLGMGEITSGIPQKYMEPQYASNAEIIIELGEDYAENPNIDPFDRLVDMETYEELTGEGETEEDSEESSAEGETTESTENEVNTATE